MRILSFCLFLLLFANSFAQEKFVRLYPGALVFHSSVSMPDSGLTVVGEVKPLPNNRNMFVARLNSKGEYLWQHEFDYTKNEYRPAIDTFPNGDILVATNAIVGLFTVYDVILLARISPSGQIVWKKTYEDTGGQLSFGDFKTMPNGNFALTGRDFHPNKNPDVLYAAMFDSAANPIWEKMIYGPIEAEGHVIRTNSKGELIVLGEASDTTGQNLIVSTLESNGNIKWTKTYNSGETDEPADLLSLPNGDILISYHRDINGTLEPAILKLDSNGNLIWNKEIMAGTASTQDSYLQEDQDGNIIYGIDGSPCVFIRMDTAANPIDTKHFKTEYSNLKDIRERVGGGFMALARTEFQSGGSSYYHQNVIAIDSLGNQSCALDTGGSLTIPLSCTVKSIAFEATIAGQTGTTPMDSVPNYESWTYCNDWGDCNSKSLIGTGSALPGFCAGTTTTLENQGWGYNSYDWYINGSYTASDTVVSQNFNAGTYNIMLVPDSASCADTAFKTLKVYANPAPMITPSDTVGICPGDTITLDAGSYQTINWSNGASTQTIQVTSPGAFSVIVYDSNECSGISPNVYVLQQLLLFPSVIGPTLLCPADTISLTTGTYDHYDWNTGDTTKSISVTTGGLYTVTVQDSGYCPGSDSLTVTASPLQASFGSDIDSLNAQFSDSSIAAVSWHWDFGDGDTSNQQNPAHSYQNYGVYWVCLTVTDSNSCSSTVCDSVEVLMPIGIDKNLTSVKIYPNPAKSWLKVSGVKVDAIRMVDSQGRHMKLAVRNKGKSYTLNLEGLPSGLYVIELSEGEEQLRRKVVVSK